MTVIQSFRAGAARWRLRGIAALGLSACIAFAAHPARAQNLVQDPSFEASVGGEVSSNPFWSLGSGGNGTFFSNSSSQACGEGCGAVPIAPNSGSWFVEFGSTSPDAALSSVLSQTIKTDPGMTYLVSFFLANTGGPGNNFSATFDGQTILSLAQADPFGYQLYSGTAVAKGTSAVLSFTGEQDPAFFLLDDVSVQSAPAPVTGGGIASALLAVAGIALHRRRRAAQRA